MCRIGGLRLKTWTLMKPWNYKILQCNINHCWDAHHLLQQYMVEQDVAIAIIAEPVHISEDWICSTDEKAAICWKPKILRTKGRIVTSGEGYVALKFDDTIIFSCYISPNRNIQEFEEYVDNIDYEVKRLKPANFLICGDFNSKARTWGSRYTDLRGTYLEDWAFANELTIANVGNVPTCVREQGESHIDITWVSTNYIHYIHDWKVREDMMSFSDHYYIEFYIGKKPTDVGQQGDSNFNPNARSSQRFPRWKCTDVDEDIMREVIEWHCDTKQFDENSEVNEIATWIRQTMTEASDAVMKRIRNPPKKKQVYWWNKEISEARKACIRSRRLWTRAKRKEKKRKENAEEIVRSQKMYKLKKKELSKLIYTAKRDAWNTLIKEIDDDPWGTPYKMVMGKLRSSAPGITEILDESDLNKLIIELFPKNKKKENGIDIRIDDWQEEWDVSIAEVYHVIKRRPISTVAPGPDGITNKIWRMVPEKMLKELANLYTLCLREGKYPTIWKTAKLVLIPKGGETQDGLPKARPICLLDEVGKSFERIIANRMHEWMAKRQEERFWTLSKNQFGFKQNSSTLDAVLKVIRFIEEENNSGNCVIAVSLDIRNAFNSIPWRHIRKALLRKRFPRHIRRILYNYLSDRKIEYINKKGEIKACDVTAGVPQGSVLGPLLWNLAYDTVLRVEKETGCDIICYADDTLILASAESYENTLTKMGIQVERVMYRIKELNLEVSVEKTEAIAFLGRNKRSLRNPSIVIDGISVPIKTNIKYLGIILDNSLSFKDHFQYIGVKINKVIRALSKLLPNLRGPHEAKRRLYANIVLSIAMYGAPIWSKKLRKSVVSQRLLNQLQRKIAIRIIAGYRTVSFDVAVILARTPPWLYMAEMYTNMYYRVKELKDNDDWSLDQEKRIKNEERNNMLQKWRETLEKPKLPGEKLRKAIAAAFGPWINRSFGGIQFHLTQLLTNHGCFGKFLYRIRKTDTMQCMHCIDDTINIDTAEHTLFDCSGWEQERDEMKRVIGEVNTLEEIIDRICKSKENWLAICKFAENVMKVKEENEREKERQEGRERRRNER